ncbi:hypothetical protein HZH66_012072 [Vespula vulgaris]|uniref:Uncharacterized protein n=1 Tax=Vespula vulgaris TaxID=7454 RepID=A0A834JC98_VESVU|nr:hypothetical protein HZH66_012072 [Vespula vulgaris]
MPIPDVAQPNNNELPLHFEYRIRIRTDQRNQNPKPPSEYLYEETHASTKVDGNGFQDTEIPVETRRFKCDDIEDYQDENEDEDEDDERSAV